MSEREAETVKQKMQRKESVLIAPCGGSALASPAGLLLTAGLGSGPVPGRTQPHKSPERTRDSRRKKVVQKRLSPRKERVLAA